ncbi:MAG: DUF1778 domain-containing protein [Psychrosphaera sp.]|nr:DUF1778 domain-containing protein [Psychrosphaera sp.]
MSTKRLNVDVPQEFYTLLKHAATHKGESIKDFVMESIQRRLDRSGNTPNDETKDVIIKANKGEDIIKHDSLEDVFAWLDNEIDDQK